MRLLKRIMRNVMNWIKYHFDDVIRVQSYKGNAYQQTSGSFNASRSLLIRETIKSHVSNLGWLFCDTTPAILAVSDEGKAVHGPIDWKHFNKKGYIVVAQSFSQCLKQ